MKYLTAFILTLQLSFALIITPEHALKDTLKADTIIKKVMILNKSQHLQVQQLAKTKLPSKLYRVYYAKKEGILLGYGILLTQKVRSKSTAVLYIMDAKGSLQNIELIAFSEPREYQPSKRWMKQFDHNSKEYLSTQDGSINNISGATLSASAVINVANLAHAIYQVVLRK